MSDDEDTTREDENPAGEGMKKRPPRNPDRDVEAVEKGVDQLERVKPY
jgi:hypothetical protein